MKKASLTLVVLMLALAGIAATTTTATPNPTKAPAVSKTATCDGKTVAFHRHRARVLISTAYSFDRLLDPSPAKDAERRSWQGHKLCIGIPNVRQQIGSHRDSESQRYDRRLRAERFRAKYTPYRCGNSWWAIPCSIIACESGFSWGAANPSGAVGPYQLLGWGAPYPVTSRADKRAHHRIAASVWRGGAGRSNWVC